MTKNPIDPLRAKMLELVEAVMDHSGQLRDYASTPGNIWLAKGELQTLTQLASDIETLLEDIKQQDAENGY